MAFDKLAQQDFSIGLELPLDNDWSASGQAKRLSEGRPFGVPDMSQHTARIKLADELGYRAAWIRDVPLYDPQFGDAAQVFEAFSYLGYLAALTNNILLGTAAVVLPLRQPWLVKKSAHTIAQLSNDRFILGVASGDRPSEYPVFNVDFDSRGERFRESVKILRGDAQYGLSGGQLVLPQANPLPLYVAGLAQQSPQWVGENMDGWLAYPGTPSDHDRRVALWRNVAQDKPYVSFIHLDYVDNADAPVERHRFGVKTGRNGLIQELSAMRDAGVNHIGLHFRRNQRDLESSMREIAEQVLPLFHNN